MGKGISLVSVLIIAAMAFWAGMKYQKDPNAEPQFGETGLPANCRALISIAIAGWRAHDYSAEDTFASLERNCGAAGYLWDYKPK